MYVDHISVCALKEKKRRAHNSKEASSPPALALSRSRDPEPSQDPMHFKCYLYIIDLESAHNTPYWLGFRDTGRAS